MYSYLFFGGTIFVCCHPSIISMASPWMGGMEAVSISGDFIMGASYYILTPKPMAGSWCTSKTSVVSNIFTQSCGLTSRQLGGQTLQEFHELSYWMVLSSFIGMNVKCKVQCMFA